MTLESQVATYDYAHKVMLGCWAKFFLSLSFLGVNLVGKHQPFHMEATLVCAVVILQSAFDIKSLCQQMKACCRYVADPNSHETPPERSFVVWSVSQVIGVMGYFFLLNCGRTNQSSAITALFETCISCFAITVIYVMAYGMRVESYCRLSAILKQKKSKRHKLL